jgi:hypothetical protein
MKQIPNINLATLDKKVLTTIVLLWLFIAISIVITIICILRLFELNEETTTLQTSVEQLKSQVALVEANKRLSKEEIAQYNKILIQLIPEELQYFEVIAAVERLSASTNFRLSNFTIDLTNKSPEKFSLDVVGSGNIETFTQFLKDYQFKSGRLISIERIEFAPDKVQNFGLLLNFYHKKVVPNLIIDPSLQKLTQQDLDLMKDIESKTTVIGE